MRKSDSAHAQSDQCVLFASVLLLEWDPDTGLGLGIRFLTRA